MSEKFFSDAIYLFMCLSQVVSCTLSCIPTVQSYDKVSVPARGFRPGVHPGRLPRVCALAGVSQWTRDTRSSRASEGGKWGFFFS